MTYIGSISHLQIQRASLKRCDRPNQTYSPDAIMAVEALRLTPDGALAVINEKELLDVHNIMHPQSKYSSELGNSLSFNLLGNYSQMRARFGDHLAPGCAGENILIESEAALVLSPADLARGRWRPPRPACHSANGRSARSVRWPMPGC